jgi:hypothetical protein
MAKLPIEEAAAAHTDLNIFAAVLVLMESSLISPHGFAGARRIIGSCKAEQARALRRYDAAVARSQRPKS